MKKQTIVPALALALCLGATSAHAEYEYKEPGGAPLATATAPAAPAQTEILSESPATTVVTPAATVVTMPAPQPATATAPVVPGVTQPIRETQTAPVPTDSSGLPQPVSVGSVRYITGGIGDEERDALLSVKNNYNLHVTSVNEAGEFLSDTSIAIKDRHGQEIVKADAGPMFYAELPAGSYTVESVHNGTTKHNKINVGVKKEASVYLRW